MTPLPESSDRKFPTRAVLAALGNKIKNKQLLKESLESKSKKNANNTYQTQHRIAMMIAMTITAPESLPIIQ